jgi:hypothetical protein
MVVVMVAVILWKGCRIWWLGVRGLGAALLV